MIRYFTEDISFVFKSKRSCSKWIFLVLQEEGVMPLKQLTDISFIFCSDDYLLNLNREFLSHDYYTDVITFDNSEQFSFSGDIFISLDRVRENAVTYNQTFIDELHRVMIHGILHLVGYDDLSDEEQSIMRNKEDYYLAKRFFNA
jgi:rRNA maturation RNase YbeY